MREAQRRGGGHYRFSPAVGAVSAGGSGYGSLPAGQGKGYGKESLRAVLDFAVNACGFHKLTATVTAGNLASRGLLESCGFQLEGTLRDNFRLAGQWYDDWLFGLLAAEFQGGK